MTRDEAIEIETKSAMAWKPADMPLHYVRQAAAETIDVYVALGMLKLDKPKSLKSKALDALFVQFGGHDIETILGLLDNAGLKIVEK